MTEQLTIMIPTKDKPEYLKRALEYYEKEEFKGTILIGDSSTPPLELDYNLNIDCNYYPPSMLVGAVWAEMVKRVNTPYIVSAGDDDFIILKGARECVYFLDNNPEFLASYGMRINFKTVNDTPRGEIERTIAFHMPDYTGTPEQRWELYLQNGRSTMFFITRSEVVKELYDGCSGTPYVVDEFLPCSRMMLMGKCQPLSTVTVAFQDRDGNALWDKTLMWDLIIKPDWSSSVEYVMKGLTASLTQIGVAEPEKAARRSLYTHVAKILYEQLTYPPERYEWSHQDLTQGDMGEFWNPVKEAISG